MFDELVQEFEALLKEPDIQNATEVLKLLVVEASTEQQRQQVKKYQQALHSYKQEAILSQPTQSHYVVTPGTSCSSTCSTSSSSHTSKTNNNLQLLSQSIGQLQECEHTGHDTLFHLGVQEEKIKSSQSKTRNINSDMHHSNSLLTRMNRFFRG